MPHVYASPRPPLASSKPSGDGQAAWDLVTRNGQDVESGLFLFTVDGPSGHQVGKFVLIR